MASFERWYETAMGWEGGYANVTGDRGGETYAGITRRNHPNWSGWAAVDAEKRRMGGTLPRNHRIPSLEAAVRSFARNEYWNFFRGDEIASQELADMVVDFGYHSGRGFVARIVQRLAGASPDGVFGPATVKAVNRANPRRLFGEIQKYRLSHVEAIAARDPSQRKFLAGWRERIMDFGRPRRKWRGLQIAAGGTLLIAAGLYLRNAYPRE